MRFRAIAVGLTGLSGNVVTLRSLGTSANLNGLAIGAATPRAFIAGNVQVMVTATRLRRDAERAMAMAWTPLESVVAPHEAMIRRQATCSSAPCAVCTSSARPNGDANGDCAFGISDVSFIQLYLSESVDGFSTARGAALQVSILPFQLGNLDANDDTTISAADARYLAGIFIGKLTFLRSASIRPVQHPFSQGRVTINVTELDSFGQAPPATMFSRVFVDVAHSSSLTAAGFANPNVGIGQLAVANKGTGQYGFVAEMQRSGPYYDSGTATVQPANCLVSTAPSAGTCTSGVFTGTRFAYSVASGICADVTPGGCVEAPPNYATASGCTAACVGEIKHIAAFTTEVVPSQLGLTEDIGYSFLLVSLSDESASASVLSTVFLKSVAQPPRYSAALNTVVPGTTTSGGTFSVPLLARSGYSPLGTFDNQAASNATANVNSPVFRSVFSANVNEGTANGTRVVTVVATDLDLAGAGAFGFITYSFTSSTAYYSQADGLWREGPFAFNGTSGVIFLAGPLDYETSSVHFLEVSASDNQPPFPRINVTFVEIRVIDANDNSPEFTCVTPWIPCVPGFYSAAVPPGAPIGTVVALVHATDVDNTTVAGGTNNQLAFSMATTGSNVQQMFGINSNGGVLLNQAITQPEGVVFTLQATVADTGLPVRQAVRPAVVYVATVNDSNMVTVTMSMPLATFAA
jgi:hypothetical protein